MRLPYIAKVLNVCRSTNKDSISATIKYIKLYLRHVYNINSTCFDNYNDTLNTEIRVLGTELKGLANRETPSQ